MGDTPVTTAPETPAVQPGDTGWLADAPELDFDKLFTDSSVAATPQDVAPTTPVLAPAAPQPAAPPEDFLKGSRTVYKSKEEAIKGIDEKDLLIEQLRGAFIQNMGVDPVSGRMVPRTVPTQTETNYADNPRAFVEAIAGAVEKKDDVAYVGTLKKFVQDAVMPILEPVRPLLENVNRQAAVSEVSKQIPEFTRFVDSQQYKDALEAVPILKDAISQAELNFNLRAQLPQLYRLAHLAASGLNTSQIVRNTEQARTQTGAQPNPSGRPLTRSSSLPPPPEAGNVSGFDRSTPEGRKAIIESLGTKLANVNIDDVFRQR